MSVQGVALAVSTMAATLCGTAAFSVGGRVAFPAGLQRAGLMSRHSSSHGPSRASVTSLRMGFLDNMFKPKVSEDDPVWMQRDFKAVARKDGSWEEFYDESAGQKYYYNTATQETLWEAEYAAMYEPEPEPEPTAPVTAGVPQTETLKLGDRQRKGGFGMPQWMQNAANQKWMQNAAKQKAAAAAFQGFTGGGANVKLDPEKFSIKFAKVGQKTFKDPEKLSVKFAKVGGGSKTLKGGFGTVYQGTYDARPNAQAAPRNVAVVVKLPSDDPDAIAAFNSEREINQRIASYGGLKGVADFLGTVDLSMYQQQLPSSLTRADGLVWKLVKGNTLDNFFDRGGGMSPVLASTLNVRNSAPVKLRTGDLAYIKTDLCKKVMGEALLPLVELHDKGIIHRDMKPQNIMLVENDQQAPFRVIDFGSAVIKGSKPLMDDFTEVYAPPEAPTPDGRRPDAYDIYTIGIIGLRVLMPSLVAGEQGVQTFARVTCEEFPANDYDFRKWAVGRTTNKAPLYAEMAVNSEIKGLMIYEGGVLYDLLADMLDRDPAKRPSAKQCLERLGSVWVQRNEAKLYGTGDLIPSNWQEGVEYAFGGEFQPGETVIIRRSDGSLKFGIVKSLGLKGLADVTVEADKFQRGVAIKTIGKLFL